HRAAVVAPDFAQPGAVLDAETEGFDVPHRFFDSRVAGVAARCDQADQVALAQAWGFDQGCHGRTCGSACRQGQGRGKQGVELTP
nr:hypothetical protein [Tanacetum cinerariifolium]